MRINLKHTFKVDTLSDYLNTQYCLRKLSDKENCIFIDGDYLEISIDDDLIQTVGLFDNSLITSQATIIDYVLRCQQKGICDICTNVNTEVINDKHDLLNIRLKMWSKGPRDDSTFETITGSKIIRSKRLSTKTAAIISSYHSNTDYLKQCLESILNQSLKTEIVIVCGGGLEEELKLISYYITNYEGITLIKKSQREPQCDSWNSGLCYTLSEIAINANTDDWWDKDLAEKLYEEADGKYGSYCNMVWHKGEKLITVDTLPFSKHSMNIFHQPGCHQALRPLRVIDKIGLYRDMIVSDYDMCSRISLIGDMGHSNVFYSHYRIHEDTISYKKSKEMQEETLLTKRRYFVTPKNIACVISENVVEKLVAFLLSLDKIDTVFDVYVCCLDDKSFEILRCLSNHFSLVNLKLRKESQVIREWNKPTRMDFTAWVTKILFIHYLLNEEKLDNILYVDSDFLALNNRFLEVYDSKFDITLFRHGDHNYHIDPGLSNLHCFYGPFNAGMIMSKNTENSIKALEWIINQLLKHDYKTLEQTTFDYQEQTFFKSFYKDQLCVGAIFYMYDFVGYSMNRGINFGPWQLNNYKLDDYDNLVVKDWKTGRDYIVSLFHMHGVKITDKNEFELCLMYSGALDIIYTKVLNVWKSLIIESRKLLNG